MGRLFVVGATAENIHQFHYPRVAKNLKTRHTAPGIPHPASLTQSSTLSGAYMRPKIDACRLKLMARQRAYCPSHFLMFKFSITRQKRLSGNSAFQKAGITIW